MMIPDFQVPIPWASADGSAHADSARAAAVDLPRVERPEMSRGTERRRSVLNSTGANAAASATRTTG